MMLRLPEITSGKVAAAFLSASAAIIMIGVLAYMRKQLEWLELYAPAGKFSGIWFYSYLIWAILWLALYFALRNKERAGSTRLWLVVFLASLAASTILVEVSLKWSLLFS